MRMYIESWENHRSKNENLITSHREQSGYSYDILYLILYVQVLYLYIWEKRDEW